MSDDEGNNDSPSESAVNALREAYNAVRSCLYLCQQWVENRSRLTQIIIAAILGQLASYGFEESGTAWSLVIGLIPSFSTEQLLLALVGVGIIQTGMQVKKFNQLESVARNMDPISRADGGRDLQPRDDEGKFTEEKSSSGAGAIGGAVAGAALGSSYGPGGAVFGAIMGAILGDEMEKGGDD